MNDKSIDELTTDQIYNLIIAGAISYEDFEEWVHAKEGAAFVDGWQTGVDKIHMGC